MNLGRTAAVFLSAALLSASACDYKPRNQGRALYERHCQSCHMENGQGLGALMPPLASADYVQQHPEQLSCIIRYGISGRITVNGTEYDGEMTGNARLTEVEISNLVHYVLEVMNDRKNPYTIGDIREQLDSCRN